MKHLIMGTAGHVDHGKTALIKTLTGKDCDTHKEEKMRGITINLGFSYLNLPNGESVGIIDVPGHKDFINTMVGGACGMDFVMLVIAADSGIMPQTVEHMNIINSLGVKKGIVALTKADLVDEELIELAKLEIDEFLEKTSLKGAPVVAVSSVTGNGKDELIKTIENIIKDIDEKEESEQFRMYIDRIFSVKGFGSVVTGSVLGGSIELEKEVFLLPGNNPKLRVRSIERHGKAVEKVVAGDRAAINLIGLNIEDFKRGMIISDKNLQETKMIDASISLFDVNTTLPLWSHVTFHAGTFESPAKMHALNKDSIKPNEKVIVQIHLEKPAIFINKDKFIIRNSSGDKTLGGGFVMDIAPLHHKKRTAALIENLVNLGETLAKGDSMNGLIKIELKKETRPFTLEEIAGKLHLKAEDLKNSITGQTHGFSVYSSPEFFFLIDHGFDKSYSTKVLEILTTYHKEFSIFTDGYDINELAGKVNLSKTKQEKAFLALLLKQMEQNGLLEKSKNTWIVKGHKPKVDAQTTEEINWLENLILDYDVQKPVMSEIEEKADDKRISKHNLKMYFSYLVKQGKITWYQSDFIHTQLVGKYRPVLLDLLRDNDKGIEINDFKDKINASKKFIAVLVSIYETEKIILTQGKGIETRIFITQSGKNYK
jgi:selenocysteine-specific elongation factor